MSNEWISVEDRLPEQLDDVLVCEKWEPLPFVAYIGSDGIWTANHCHLECDTGIWGNGGIIIDNFESKDITHWMPLPSPPDTGEK